MSLALRPLRADDAAQVLAWRNSPEVAAFMYTDGAISPEAHAAWLAAALEAEDRRYWIVELDGRGVGLANLARIDRPNRRCDWAYYLADPATRGRGAGACVEYAVIEHVFGKLGFNKLWCEVLIGNEAVWKLHQKFGFRQEALLRAHIVKAGRPIDVMGLGLLAEEWPAVRPAMVERLRRLGYEVE